VNEDAAWAAESDHRVGGAADEVRCAMDHDLLGESTVRREKARDT
jgi:hypothetical protein